ncbi:MAG TPA: ABC transporter ATP-binding protein [Chthonomonadaceae bacterium]|nr:ABC transporter ATP-binding protein [Chthonomonadaceae bacterium]
MRISKVMETEPHNAPRAEDSPPRFSLIALRRLLALALPYRRVLAAAGALMLVSTAISLSLPLVARSALDRVLQTHQIGAVDRLALALLGLILLGAAFTYGQYVLVAYAGNRIVLDVRRRLYAHLLRLPVAFFDRTRSGDLTSRLANDVSQLQQSLTEDLVRLAGNLITLVGGLALAIAIDARLTGVVVGLLAGTLALFMLLGRRLRGLHREALEALSEAMGGMTEALSNIRLVKAFAREAHEDRRAGAKLETVFRLALKSSAFDAGLGTLVSAAFLSMLLGLVWYGGRSVLAGQLSAGSLLAFLMTITLISGPMASLATLYGRLQRALGASDRLFAILDDSLETPDPPDALPFPDGPGRVTFEQIDFAYTPDTPVLCGLSLDVPAGKVTALVGASGAGKTTLALLLYRFDPQQGCIRIDGVPISAIRRQDLREHIGLVPQEPVLFNGTIRENIRYGRLTAMDAEVEAAARAANVEEFVSQWPRGYETVLGERGITLSGGQRQRVAIARALLKDPRILVLDEATSALDTRSETLVRQALVRLMQGRTTLIIAHRLTTIRNADRIAVLNAGQVAEMGTHDQLLRAHGLYAALHDLPSKAPQ